MREIKRILVPIDFSTGTREIIPYALAFAGKFNAKLYLIYVVQELRDFRGFYEPHISLIEFEKEVAGSAEKKMRDFVEEHMQGLDVDARVIIGDISETVIKLAASEKIDLIIMATHGRKGIDRAVFGSVAEKVLKTAPCPVLTIRPKIVL